MRRILEFEDGRYMSIVEGFFEDDGFTITDGDPRFFNDDNNLDWDTMRLDENPSVGTRFYLKNNHNNFLELSTNTNHYGLVFEIYVNNEFTGFRMMIAYKFSMSHKEWSGTGFENMINPLLYDTNSSKYGVLDINFLTSSTSVSICNEMWWSEKYYSNIAPKPIKHGIGVGYHSIGINKKSIYMKGIIDDTHSKNPIVYGGIGSNPFSAPFDNLNVAINNFIVGNEKEIEDYPGFPNTEQGGDGDFDTESDVIDVPSLPSFDMLESGFIEMYELSYTESKGLHAYLWSNDLTQNLFKMFSDPMENIFSYSITNIPPSKGERKNIRFGNIDSNIESTSLTSQYTTVDCGEISLKEFWGNAFDYSPYTNISIYLPYVGYVNLDIDLLMCSSMSLTYHCDLLTGACVAFLKATKEDNISGDVNAVVGQYNGNCLVNMPLSASNWSQIYSSLIGGVFGVASSVASKNASGVYSSVVGGVLGSKLQTQQGGALSSTYSLMSILKPFLILERPVQTIADNYKHYNGFPSNITHKLSELNGFTKVSQITLECSATDDEKTMIESILKDGFYI